MINIIWLGIIVVSFITSVYYGNLDILTEAIFRGTSDTVDILIKLVGPMAFWLGLMNIAEKSGLTQFIGKLLKPVFKILFPEVPTDHPAAGSILLNLSANIFGLGNSATPLGIKAMKELQKLNSNKNEASPSMCTLLALNTSSITILPATIISLRAAFGSIEPASIIVTTLFATSISTITAILFDKIFRLFSQ